MRFKMFPDSIKCWLMMPFLVMAVFGDCTLKIESDSAIITKRFGSKRLKTVTYNNRYDMINDEIISVYCSKYVEFRSNYNHYIKKSNNVKSLQILCSSNKILYSRPEDKHYSNDSINYGFIKCYGGHSSILYETSNILPNCKPLMTYSIGKSFSATEQMVIARICYNFDVLHLKYVQYFAYRNNYEFLFDDDNVTIENITSNDITEKWNLYFSFMSSVDFNTLYSSRRTDFPILKSINFTYASIIQDIPLQEELKNYENLLSIIWWNNLKDGNWKLYLNALRDRTDSNKYNVYTGTFDEMKVPTLKCTNNETLDINFKGITHAVPKYIWSYIKSVSSNASGDELVVIGYNSPFYENLENLIFCEDICDDIDWMKMTIFNRVRRMVTMGLVFCCRPEAVIKIYPDFPMFDKQQSTTSTVSETTTLNYDDENGMKNLSHDFFY